MFLHQNKVIRMYMYSTLCLVTFNELVTLKGCFMSVLFALINLTITFSLTILKPYMVNFTRSYRVFLFFSM